MQDVSIHEHLISLVDSADTFMSAVESSLALGPEARDQRVREMTKETWPEKLELICNYSQDETGQ